MYRAKMEPDAGPPVGTRSDEGFVWRRILLVWKLFAALPFARSETERSVSRKIPPATLRLVGIFEVRFVCDQSRP